MAREWMDAPNATMSTKFGPVELIINDHNSVYIEGNRLSVRGMEVRATLHVTINGAEIKSEDRIYTTRRDDWKKEVSRASEKAIEEEYKRALWEFYSNPDNANLFRQARLAYLNNGISRKEEERDKLAQQLTDLINEISGLQKDYDAVANAEPLQPLFRSAE